MMQTGIEGRIRFRQDINTSYMVIEETQDFSPHRFMVQMLLKNEIEGLLRTRCENINGRYYLLYDISSRQAFSKVLETKKISYEQLKDLILSLKGLLYTLQEYLLDADHIILRPECIFLEPDRHQFFYCYDPYYQGDLTAEIRMLTGKLLPLISYDDDKAIRLAYEMQAVVQKDFFTINDLTGAYERIAEDSLPKVQKLLPPEEEEIPVPDAAAEDAAWELPAVSGEGYEDRILYQTDSYEDEEETSFLKKVRYYFKGKKFMDVLEDMNNREFLSKVRQCGSPSEYEEQKEPASVFSDEKKEALEYVDIRMQAPEFFVAEEADYMTERAGSGGTVLLSAYGRESRKLVGLHERQGTRFVIRSFPFTIGKSGRDCDACLDESTISRLHARIYEEGGTYYLEDMNSTNGTFLNERRLSAYTRAPLSEGDILRFAEAEFCFR